MNMKLITVAILCAVGVNFAHAESDYTYQALYWQLDSANLAPYGSEPVYAYLYAKVDGDTIRVNGDGHEVSEVTAGAVNSVFDPKWNWGDYDISQASFYVELWNSSLDTISTSFVAPYASMVQAMDRTERASGQHYTASSTYTFYFAIPEPTSAMLMLLGVAGLALKRKRRS